MRPMHLVFLQRRAYPSMSAVALALSFTTLAVICAAALLVMHRLEASREGIARLQQRMAAESTPKVPARRDEVSEARNTAMTAELAFPWDELFGAVETARTESIILASLEPETSSGIVHITAHATSYQEALGFIDRLAHRGVFGDVILVSRNPEPNGKPGLTVSLDAQWIKR